MAASSSRMRSLSLKSLARAGFEAGRNQAFHLAVVDVQAFRTDIELVADLVLIEAHERQRRLEL